MLIYITENATLLAPRRHVYRAAARISSNHQSELLNSQSMSNQTGTPEENAPQSKSFEEAASPYFEDIRRFCVSRAGNRERGEDIAQEALIRAFKSWDTFTDLGHGPKAWMFTIAARQLISSGIKQTKLDEKQEYAYENEDGVVNHGFDKFVIKNLVNSPEMQVIEKFGIAEIEAAVDSLDEEFRDVAFQKFIVGLGNKEIADLLGLKQNTVGSKVSRAREKLHEALKEIAAGYGIGVDEDKKK
ncbi:MAG: RNA polymerase sigma factor [Rhodoluna sp.]|nr:RNA polymerase sigma factor [Rhodoluna sp.]